MSRKSRYNQDLLLQKVIRWKAGCYVRLSKEDKEYADNSQSVLAQKQMIEKFLQAHPDIELYDYFVDDKVIDVNMHRLRGKIEDEPAQPKHLVTIWGMGYKWIV